MKPDDVATLVKHRLEQAHIALEDAKYLIDGNRSTQSIINRSYYAMFYATLALPKEFSKAFHKAFQLRQATDYQVMAPIRWESAEEVYKQSARFVDAVAAHFEKTAGMESPESG